MRYSFVAVVLLAVAAIAGAETISSSPDPLHTSLGPVPSFRLTDRSGRTITQEDLRGKMCVVSFFFTSCTAGCARTQASMKLLQDDLASYPNVLLVSITVDPENDTLEVLRRYAEQWKADPTRWLFLTGPEKEIYQLIRDGFFQAVDKNKQTNDPGMAVVHSFRLMVVNRQGEISGYIRDGREPDEVTQLEARIKELAAKVPWPAINASLNGCCAVLLVLGYLSIRTRRIVTHKVLMLCALAVSAAFLTCYLYYHLVVQHGEPTRFTGDGLARPVYFSILLSHTALAVVVAPLALVTTYLGLRDRLSRHMALARWTLPLWLYVSVTGVVVYWMLYHLYSPV
jgi:protein SCO1/2